MAKQFEELECWQLGIELDKEVYRLIETSRIDQSLALKDQLLRSAGSISDNIAEGFERCGNKEFIQFLFIAKGSCGELPSQFRTCKERVLIDEKVFTDYYDKCRTVSVEISNLITYSKNSEIRGPNTK